MKILGIDFTKLSGRQFLIVQVFTAVETYALGKWLEIIFPSAIGMLEPRQGLIAVIFLYVVLDIEHLLAVVTKDN